MAERQGVGAGSRVGVANKMFSLKIFALTPAAAATATAAEAKAPKAAASYWP